MDAHRSTHFNAQYRNADVVMAPERLGAMHQTRISFVRTLIRKMANQRWSVTNHQWELCPQGFGHVVYQLKTPENIYHLVVFCTEIEDGERNDRVIAEKWDVTFALVKGEVSQVLLNRLRENVPLQEAGRNPNNVLVLARANKSVRVFEHIVSSLANGIQPEANELAKVGYILRTTAVYGNGKFGIADFKLLENNPDFKQSFSAQMCAVYLLREFSLDWVNYLAKLQGGDRFVELDRSLQRYLGVGNATGLGMAPYLINHPCIVDQWLTARESALSEVLCQSPDEQSRSKLVTLLNKAIRHLDQVVTIDEPQKQLNTAAVQELQRVVREMDTISDVHQSWGEWLEQCTHFSLETQESITSCLMELYPEKVDKYQDKMNCDESLHLEGHRTVQQFIDLLETRYHWAINTDYSQHDNRYWFWYRSQDKEEPRLGVRDEEPGEEKELPLDIGRQVNKLYHSLIAENPSISMAEFSLKHPKHRAIARRAWTLGNKVMGDIQMNVLHKDALPMHLLRCKLAMFGATKFDPRSDRWVRVTFFQGAPLLDEINEDEWVFPTLPSSTEYTGGKAP
ncbi:hypothetical protein [Vibrio penaeicida]|uniref:TIGR04141 family sporadically distributed protein n=1 Tax=Vibrio penaeicida TaxID=104609 RepID=A0AAV5P1F6_9VIBR|nr:hypothetical protein [Vibrio penaeicida]RTZ24171.1 hypothetical protein EKN09_05185 [Vibrio penaeicida]GLQ76430.1 hypothetical protein GCM10007932_57930 [Vibrio penaeicida]